MLLAMAAALTLLGHICPPSSAHTLVTATGESHDASGSEAAHLASCDATTSRSGAPLVGGAAGVASVVAQPVSRAVLAGWDPPSAVAVRPIRAGSSPPLFLLHASFLV